MLIKQKSINMIYDFLSNELKALCAKLMHIKFKFKGVPVQKIRFCNQFYYMVIQRECSRWSWRYKKLTGLRGSPSGPREVETNCESLSLGWWYLHSDPYLQLPCSIKYRHSGWSGLSGRYERDICPIDTGALRTLVADKGPALP